MMQIDFAFDAERSHGLSSERAIYEGCLIRFRPIMITRIAALLGAVPIAVRYGAGGEARQPLGLVVVGGSSAGRAVGRAYSLQAHGLHHCSGMGLPIRRAPSVG
jgi:multidrug efflux pump subunit AcrB